jgi:hypothetical protein
MNIPKTSNSPEITESNSPANHFRQFQNHLRETLAQTMGGQKLDEASPDQSHYPYETAASQASVE